MPNPPRKQNQKLLGIEESHTSAVQLHDKLPLLLSYKNDHFHRNET